MHKDVTTTLKSPTFAQRFEDLSDSKQLVMKEEVKHLYTLTKSNQKLAECDPSTVIDSMYSVASIGLSLNPVLQQCAIIPRYNKKSKVFVAAYMPMYRGLVKLAYDTGSLKTFEVENVYEADDFEMTKGTSPELNHKPNLRLKAGESGNAYIGTYVIAYLKDMDIPQIEWVSAEQMYKIREKSESKDFASSPWKQWFGEMAKKAALKRAQKRWPQAQTPEWTRLSEAVERDNEASFDKDAIEGESELLISVDQQTALKDKLEESNTPADIFCKTFSIDSLEELQSRRYDEAIERCNNRIEALRQRPR